MLQFNYETGTLEAGTNYNAQDLLRFITKVHTYAINSGAWDRLVDYDTETAQQIEILARMGA